ncbi:arsenate reductase ArsC [Profundibacter sp.]
MNILVLCTGNSARSILLESILNHASDGRITAFSAGSNPAGKVHPQSLKLLAELGHDIAKARSKSWDAFAMPDAPKMDLVITVCGSAAAETCPIWPGAPLRCHWGVEDPADCTDDCDVAFRTTYDILARRAAQLLALPFEGMEAATLKPALAQIGQQV